MIAAILAPVICVPSGQECSCMLGIKVGITSKFGLRSYVSTGTEYG